jgi:DMSO reductase anchor subunit
MVCILGPEKQKEWGWAAVANFFLGGAGAGYYSIHFLAKQKMFAGFLVVSQPYSAVISNLLMSLGLLCVAFESGRPLLGYRVFQGIKHSWISREMLCYILFLCLTIADILMPFWWCDVAMTITALSFIGCQAMIVHVSSAIKQWRPKLIIILILSNSLVSGVGILYIADSSLVQMQYRFLISLGAILVALNNLIWFFSIFLNPVFLGIQPWKSSVTLRLRIGVGRFISLVLLVFILFFPTVGMSSIHNHYILSLIGIMLLIGSHALLYWMLREAGLKSAVCFEN